MKKVVTCLALIALSKPALAKTARSGQTGRSVEIVTRNPEIAASLKGINMSLVSFGAQKVDLTGVNLDAAAQGKLAADLTGFKAEIDNDPAQVTRLSGLPEAVSGSLKSVDAFKKSSDPLAKGIIADVALNGVNSLKAALHSGTSVKTQEALYSKISRAGYDGRITKAEISGIVAVALENGLKLEEVAGCK